MARNDDSSSQGSSGSSDNRQGNASNLSHEDRVRGGEHSAQEQSRDENGQFAGRSGNSGNSGSSTGSSGSSGSNY